MCLGQAGVNEQRLDNEPLVEILTLGPYDSVVQQEFKRPVEPILLGMEDSGKRFHSFSNLIILKKKSQTCIHVSFMKIKRNRYSQF